MGKNIYQKKDIVKGVKHELQNAQLIFSTDMTKLNINQVLYSLSLSLSLSLIFSTDMTKLNTNQVLYTHTHSHTHMSVKRVVKSVREK